MLITIAGCEGVGKSTVARTLAAALGYEYYSIGRVWREEAAQQGTTIAEYYKKLGQNLERDRAADRAVEKLSYHDNIVVDGRAAWHFLPSSYKVFLKARDDIRVRRVYSSERSAEKYSSLAETAKMMEERSTEVRNRMRELYQIDVQDESNFDLVIDTSDLSVKQVVNRIRRGIGGQV